MTATSRFGVLVIEPVTGAIRVWTQAYKPILDNLAYSGLAALFPIVVLGYALAIQRTTAWKASLAALISAILIACTVYGMPPALAIAASGYGALFGLFALGWMVFAAILLFDVVVASGRFEDIRRSLASVSPDARIQALLVAFAFGAFIEGASGAGTPVAICATLLAGLGFPPFLAAGISLLANTAPVAYGALGLPIVTLSGVTEFPLLPLSAAVGRVSPVIAVIVPSYLVLVLGGRRALAPVWPAALVCGVAFAGTQFLVSNFIGPHLADILSALVTIGAMLALLTVWHPSKKYKLAAVPVPPVGPATTSNGGVAGADAPLTRSAVVTAWMPYLLLVVLILIWGAAPVQRLLDAPTLRLEIPALHNAVQRVPPAVPQPSSYAAVFTFNWLSANGTACFLAAVLAAALAGLGTRRFVTLAAGTFRRLLFAELTFALMMALAYVMNYGGMSATLGLMAATTGVLFPFFSAYLGWLGVFLTGSDTSSNALFGNLQVVSARALDLNPMLAVAANTSGGVMGKMISVASIAVAAAATGLKASDEGRLFRFTLWHSVLLTACVGLVCLFYAYAAPGLMPQP
jgi:lactate permease